MLHPYVYLATGKSRDVHRYAPSGARVAIHYPGRGRCVELYTDAQGRYVLGDRPAAGAGGSIVVVARGELGDDGQPGTHNVADAAHVREAADCLRAFHASNTNALAERLDAIAQRMDPKGA